MSRVVLAMSGGVDSSVAAWLLQREGHEVVGVFMRHGQEPTEACQTDQPENSSKKQGCCSETDATDARRVADKLGIPFYVLNFEEQFAKIIDFFVAQYLDGRTPNPCILCNNWLKFGKLFEYADSIGAQYVATGHYAQLLLNDEGETGLYRGLDPTKDQSYVLFGIQRPHLRRLLFPIGPYHKQAIREIAAEAGFPIAQKRDSQEICFIPDQDHARFIRERPEYRETQGEIVTTDNQIIGHHDGYERFTIGQRKGLKVAFSEPRYVVRIEPETHRVVLGLQEDLARTELTASNANWLVKKKRPHESFFCEVKIRYRTKPIPASVTPLENDRFQVEFFEPCHAIAPGQAAVCYDKDHLLGGGWID